MNGPVGVVVVTYNSAEVIGPCLDSCVPLRTVVVDNASHDDTVQQVRRRPGVELIVNSSNRGFAAAVNQGVQRSTGEFILLLNPDVRLRTGITALVEACQESHYGMATGCLRGPDGIAQRGFAIRRLPGPVTLILEVLGLNRLLALNPVNQKYRCFDFDFSQAADVEQPAGAFLLFRKDLWMQLRGFDESFYPLWFEDVDFCMRALRGGVKIRYVPDVKADHQGGHSVSQLAWSHREHYWYVSLLRYASKHFRSNAFRAVSAAVMLGSVFRTVFWVVRKRSFEPRAVYASVVRLAAKCAFLGRMPAPAVGSAKAVE